jgi:PAS domain S-box-containing protein
MFGSNDPVLFAEADCVNEPKLQYLSTNKPFTYITAYTLEELLGNIGILKAVKNNSAVIAQICLAISAWQPVCAEFVSYSQDGSECWIELDLAPVANEMGDYTHWISIERDISERKRVEVALKQQTEREQLLVMMAQRIRSSLNLEEILNTTVAEVRQFLQTQRVFIYRFEPDWSGVITVESVASGWFPILGRKIKDSYFVEPHGRQLYKQGRIQATADISTVGLSQCHIELLS